jgi:DNA-binding MarR family transcriptional regulator
MQQLADETIKSDLASECAEQLLEVTPLLMRKIRSEMRRRTMGGLSVPQYRTLNFLMRHPRTSLRAVAEHLGLTPPSTSKLVQKLVVDKIIARRVATDRRRVCLSLTQSGIAALTTARSETRQQLADGLKSLSKEELAALEVALRALGRVFSRGSNDVNVS